MHVFENCSLAEILWYRIGGNAKYVLDVSSQEDVIEALAFIKRKEIANVLIVGLGSNLLVSDDFFDGAVIHFVPRTQDGIQRREDGQVEAFAGELLDSVIQFGFENNLIGLEWAGGLPGIVGAGVRGNVGAFGGEIKDVIESVEGIDSAKQNSVVEKVDNKTLHFTYRSSLVKQQQDFLVLSATFQLQKATVNELEVAKKQYHDNIVYRQTNHPLEYPSCGSTFKNIKTQQEVEKILAVFPDVKALVDTKWHGKVSAGYLIKRLGFSGYKKGNAQVSKKHANFIVNLGGATFSDVTGIIDIIQQAFEKSFGFIPEPEIQILG